MWSIALLRKQNPKILVNMFLQRNIWLKLLKTINNRNFVRIFHCDIRKQDFYKFIRKPAKPSKPVFSHSKLMGVLQNCQSVSEQIENFNSYVKLTEEDVVNRVSICNRIENVLKSTFPDCSIHIVGSSINGLGMKGCDMDLTFQFTSSQQTTSVQTNIIPNVDVLSGKISVSKISALTVKQQLLFLEKLLKGGGLIETATVVPGRIPILNFHVNDVSCDLSISNRTALLGTYLMKLCANQDERVVLLYSLVSYWSKHCKLVGGPMKFKSYSVFMLVVYFLQRRNPPILPTFEELFQKIEFFENFDNWLCNTNHYEEISFSTNNTESIEKLLRGFFFFYSSFDFSSVICTLNAQLKPGKHFILENPSFELNTLSIQDPLNLNCNITNGVNWKYCKGFIRELLSVCNIYQESPQHLLLDTKWGITTVLDSQVDDRSFATKKNFELTVPLTKLDEPLTAAGKVFKLLNEALLFLQLRDETERICFQNPKPATTKRTDQDLKSVGDTVDSFLSDNSLDRKPKNIFRVVYVPAQTWQGRSNYNLPNYDYDELSFLETEAKISSLVLENRNVKENKEDFKFVCEISSFYESGSCHLYINLKSLNSDVFIPKLGIFLKEYILKYALRYL